MMAKQRRSILEKTYKEPNIDDKSIKGILSHPKFFRGHVRTSTGKIYKTEEFRERSNKILGMRMP